MHNLFVTIVQAIAAFFATNLDDILVLMLFFSQAHCFRLQVVLGQYLGFGALVLLSLPGYFGGALVPKAWIGLLGLLPLAIGLKMLWKTAEGESAAPEISAAPTRSGWIGHLLSPLVYQVAAVTIANGGDNISIYIPLFAGKNVGSLLVVLGTFFLLVGVWCLLAIALVRQPVIAKLFTAYGDRLVPWVFIALGSYILYESGTVTFFFGFARS